MKQGLTWIVPVAALAGVAASCGSSDVNVRPLPGDDGGGADATTGVQTADAATDDGTNPATDGETPDAESTDAAQNDGANVDASNPDAALTDASNADAADAESAAADAAPDATGADAADASIPPDAAPDATEAAAPDAGPFPCHGVPLPTTAPGSVELSGSTAELTATGLSPLSGETVTALASSNDATIATTTSDSSGAFSVTASTGGAPLDAYFHASKAGIIDSYFYPAAPFAADATDIDFLLVTSTTLAAVTASLGLTQSATKGTFIIMVVDCGGNPVTGATVSTSPAGTVYYDGSNGIPSAAQTSTNADGLAVVFNVPAGSVTVGAQDHATTFRSHVVKARAGTFTLTRIAP